MRKFLANMQAGLALRAEELLANSPGSAQAKGVTTRSEEDQNEDEPLDAVLQRILSRVRCEEVRRHVTNASPSRYVKHHSVRLQALTYNVAGKTPSEDLSLAGWLEPGHGEAAADVVAIGFQELVPLHAGNVLTGGEDRVAAAAWISLIQATLNPPPGTDNANTGGTEEDHYVLLAERQLVGLYLTVWVHVRMLPYVRGIQICTVATGFGGVLANKGAVAIRMRVYDTGICWVCSHLAAGDSQAAFARRLLDFQEIIERVRFLPDSSDNPTEGGGGLKWESSSLIVGPSSRGDWGPAATLLAPCHHHTIFMGDLNFRTALPHHFALMLLRAGNLEALLLEDGLRKGRLSEEFLQEWEEAPITFPPTFKFRPGTHEYVGETANPSAPKAVQPSEDGSEADTDDEKEVEKLRTPSWTDRVLWRSRVPGLKSLAYTCGQQTFSDHRPVVAAFLLEAKEYDIEVIASLVEEGWRELDLAELAALPKCELHPKAADFPEVEFGVPMQQSLVLRNTGASPAHFRFLETPGLLVDTALPSISTITPQWLELDPVEGLIEQGGEIDIRLKVHVTGGSHGCARHVVEDLQGKLDQILVLHIAGGSDFFVSVTGSYIPSVFGLPLERLPAAGGMSPVMVPDSSGGEEGGGSVPDVVLKLTDFLLDSNRLQTPGIFIDRTMTPLLAPPDSTDPSAAVTAQQLQRIVSAGQDIPRSANPHDVAEVLMQLFSELPRPFMPEPVIQICDVCLLAPDAAIKLVRECMAPRSWATFCHMVELMKQALEPTNSAVNSLTISALSNFLAEMWFPQQPQHFGLIGGGSGDRMAALEVMQQVADGTSTVEQRRADFVALFLLPDD